MALCWKYGIYPSWSTGIQEMPAWTLPPALRPLFQRIFILNWDISMVGQSEWFWEWWFHNLFQDIPLFAPPSSFRSKAAFWYMEFSFAEISAYFLLSSCWFIWESHDLFYCLFSPLWRPESVFTHSVSQRFISTVKYTPIGKAPVRYHGGDKDHNYEMLKTWWRKQKHLERAKIEV